MSSSSYTRPATWDDVKTVARLLNEHGVRYALIGGYAIATHGFVRFSEDVDILVDPDADNTRRWIEALSHLPDGACVELAGDTDLFSGEGPAAIRINDEITVDVMASACGHPWSELSRFVEEVVVDGVGLKVLSMEGLLKTKGGMRDRDRADAAVLQAAIARMKEEP